MDLLPTEPDPGAQWAEAGMARYMLVLLLGSLAAWLTCIPAMATHDPYGRPVGAALVTAYEFELFLLGGLYTFGSAAALAGYLIYPRLVTLRRSSFRRVVAATLLLWFAVPVLLWLRP